MSIRTRSFRSSSRSAAQARMQTLRHKMQAWKNKAETRKEMFIARQKARIERYRNAFRGSWLTKFGIGLALVMRAILSAPLVRTFFTPLVAPSASMGMIAGGSGDSPLKKLAGAFRSRKSKRNKTRRQSTTRNRLNPETLEQRMLLAGDFYVNDNWNLVEDNGAMGVIDAGDKVDASNDLNGPVGTFILDDGTGTIGNAFGPVTTGAATGVVTTAASIQHAIDAATAGNTVEVAPGSYSESLQINKSLTLQSTAGSGDTTIELLTSNASLVIGGAGSDVTLEGFTISNYSAPSLFAHDLGRHRREFSGRGVCGQGR